jgi:lipopolysaccharide transport system ATP-binding protein
VAAAAVVFDGVWKKFRRGERHDSLRDLIPSLARRALGRGRSQKLEAQEFWALKDVSFEVQPGQALGIIGPNGAGKSTTLKLLTRILKPTRGRCALQGRIGALIEVAAGFHPDLTGRENVFLQGSIMGMKPTEVRSRLDAIVDFAGVSEFIDTPVKRYSSGMNARLGFSIAAHLAPDVMIIDEVLSVGDMSFQARCLDRMIEFKKSGAAIVLVSHNLEAINHLCDRSLYIAGSAKALGPTEAVISRYIQDRFADDSKGAGTDVAITDAQLLGVRDGERSVSPGRQLTLRVTYLAEQAWTNLTFGFLVRRSNDQMLVFDANVSGEEAGLPEMRPGEAFSLDFKFAAHLARGHYQVGCHVYHNGTSSFLGRLDTAAALTVHETLTHSGTAYLGLDVSPSNLPPVNLTTIEEQSEFDLVTSRNERVR